MICILSDAGKESEIQIHIHKNRGKVTSHVTVCIQSIHATKIMIQDVLVKINGSYKAAGIHCRSLNRLYIW